MSEFVPNTEAAIESIRMIATLQTSSHEVLELTDILLSDERFIECSGSSRREAHHYGDGGLLIHTHEVIQTCMAMRDQYLQYDIDEAELFLAALFHDSGKMYDYEREWKNDCTNPTDSRFCVPDSKEWVATPHKNKIHHICRSALIWNDSVKTQSEEFQEKYADPVLHAILSHHGCKKWGSPVHPQTRVAWLLHLCDGISARLNDVDTFKGGYDV